MGQTADGEERATRRRPGAERLLAAASDLFYRDGIRAVGVDTIAERAGVSKRTLYNRFESKDELIAAYLRNRDERWKAYLRDATEQPTEPRHRLLAVFDAYGEWLLGGAFRGCPFANAVAELPNPDHPARVVARQHKDGVKEHLTVLATQAGYDEPRVLAERLLLLLEGATALATMRRSHEPIDLARKLAQQLLDA
jgi:AcrR family transcriptional regulator